MADLTRLGPGVGSETLRHYASINRGVLPAAGPIQIAWPQSQVLAPQFGKRRGGMWPAEKVAIWGSGLGEDET